MTLKEITSTDLTKNVKETIKQAAGGEGFTVTCNGHVLGVAIVPLSSVGEGNESSLVGNKTEAGGVHAGRGRKKNRV